MPKLRPTAANIRQLFRYVTAASIGAILSFLYLSSCTGGKCSSSMLQTTTNAMRTMNINEDLHLNLEDFNWGKKNFFGSAYMKRRSNLDYYKAIVRLAQHYAPDAKTVIDVGAPWPFVTAFDWIPEKTMLNDRYPDGISAPGTTFIQTDFYKFEPEKKYDLVICNQVMEHVDYPQHFAMKLLSIGKVRRDAFVGSLLFAVLLQAQSEYPIFIQVVIASVPYKWPAAHSFGHKQHLIEIRTFLNWFNRTDYSEVGVINEVNRICGKSCKRLYVVYRPPVAEEDKVYEPSHTKWNDDNDGKNHADDPVAEEEDIQAMAAEE